MLNSLTLPPYSEVKQYEGKGNWAVGKYYKWPHRFFYRHKLKMAIDMIRGNHYYNILDFGAGYGILTEELGKYASKVKSLDKDEILDHRWNFDVIMALSVLEFVNLPSTLTSLRFVMNSRSVLVVASPMSNWLTKEYFGSIKDYSYRCPHQEIKSAIEEKFIIKEYKEWMGLYFALKAVKR